MEARAPGRRPGPACDLLAARSGLPALQFPGLLLRHLGKIAIIRIYVWQIAGLLD